MGGDASIHGSKTNVVMSVDIRSDAVKERKRPVEKAKAQARRSQRLVSSIWAAVPRACSAMTLIAGLGCKGCCRQRLEGREGELTE